MYGDEVAKGFLKQKEIDNVYYLQTPFFLKRREIKSAAYPSVCRFMEYRDVVCKGIPESSGGEAR